LRIPLKAISHSGGKPITVPGGNRQASERPDWLASLSFDINAKTEGLVTEAGLRQMLQDLRQDAHRQLCGYPPETVIAEKFQAMVMLGIGNSRMKDFFDIWTLARTHNFRLKSLKRSVRQTFERRRTPLPTTAPVAFTEVFLLDENKQTQWTAFGNRSGLDLPTLQSVGAAIEEFVMPVLGAEDALDLVWTAPGPWR
jgi:hypothetical protein